MDVLPQYVHFYSVYQVHPQLFTSKVSCCSSRSTLYVIVVQQIKQEREYRELWQRETF